jgi:hypothetical protein
MGLFDKIFGKKEDVSNSAENKNYGQTEYGQTEYGQTEYGQTEYGQGYSSTENINSQGSSEKAKVEINSIYYINGVGMILTGKVIFGVFTPGLILNIAGKEGTVKDIEANHKKLSQANVGENIGFNLTNFGPGEILKGEILNFR